MSNATIMLFATIGICCTAVFGLFLLLILIFSAHDAVVSWRRKKRGKIDIYNSNTGKGGVDMPRGRRRV